MKGIYTTVRNVVLLFLCLFLTAPALAQSAGSVTGRVTDAESGEALPGANVYLQGTNIGVATDRFGGYTLDKVPAGSYTLMTSYIGYESYSSDIDIAGGATLEANIELSLTAVQTEDVVVEGLRQGQVKALNQQMTADNIRNVISREEMEKFPDMNTAEVLQRMPGVAVQRSLGEGRFVNIRGTEARLSTVTVNGEKIASPQDEERYIGLDVINASQLASIEVSKTLTPKMDGDAIGGTVNLVTRSAFDYEGAVVKINLGGGYSQLGGDPLYRGSVLYSTKLGEEKKFGITLNANWYRNNIIGHSDEMDWDDQEDVNGSELPMALDDFRLYRYKTQRDHLGLSADLEYKPNSSHRFFVRGMFNQRNDDQTRDMLRLRVSKGDYLNATTISDARFAFEFQDRDEIQNIMSIAAGGVSSFGALNMDYTVSYSYAEEIKDNPGQFKSEWQLDEKPDVILDLSDVDFPKFNVTNMDASYYQNAANWEIDNQDFRTTFTSNTKTLGTVNFLYPFRGSGYQAEIEWGGKIQMETKDRDSDRWRYKWRGDEDIRMSAVASDERIEDFLQDNYVFAPFVDEDKYNEFFEANRDKDDALRPQLRRDDSDGAGGKYDATEDIFAAYLMGTFEFGQLEVLAGIRNEYTQTSYDGFQLLYDDGGDFLNSTKVSNEKSYNTVFPHFHLKYKVSPLTNLRAALTGGIARPNYFDLAPYEWVFPEDLEIVLGNPELDPTTSTNIDVMFDHYFQGIGVISAGFFYKILDKVTYLRVYKQQGGAYDGYDVEQPVNGGSANLYGFEINWMQQFTFLPGFASGFGVFANYTYTKSEADLDFRDWDVLPGQAGDVGNFGLSYEKDRLSARLSMNYTSEVLDEVGKNEDFDRYIDERLQVDFSANYEFIDGFNFYLDLINITNAPQREYYGVSTRPRLNQYHSWSLRSGFKLNL